jgi:hypothetical protein
MLGTRTKESMGNLIIYGHGPTGSRLSEEKHIFVKQCRWVRSVGSTCEWQNAETLYPSSVKELKNSLSIVHTRFNFQSLLAFSRVRDNG